MNGGKWSFTIRSRTLADAARGDRSGLGRSAALFAGLAITTAGYVRGRFATAPSEARATRSVAKPGS